MIAAGASAGVSVAFGAPIGGALFSYEISKPNTFWTFSMLWRVFGCTCIACFTLSLLNSLATGSPLSLADSGAIKFGTVDANGQNAIYDLPAAVVLGVVTGLLGALFIHGAIWLSVKRKSFVAQKWQKVVECCIFALLTSTVFYAVVILRSNECRTGEGESLLRFSCSEGQYNPLATLIFNTEGGTLRQFFRYP
jgi:chloride channel 3/4/5